MVRYKLWKKVLGWDYIYWENYADSGIARVLVDGKGNPFYWRYKTTEVADQITDSNQVIWLTCNPSKYIKRKG